MPKEFDHFFGGTTGKILNLAKPPFELSTTTNNWIYYLTWGIALVLLVAAWLLVRVEDGTRLHRRSRDSEVAARVLGISLGKYRTLAFGISAFYAGVAGSLYAIANAYVNPDVLPDHPSVYLRRRPGGRRARLALRDDRRCRGDHFLQNHADTVARWLNHLPALSLDPRSPGSRVSCSGSC